MRCSASARRTSDVADKPVLSSNTTQARRLHGRRRGRASPSIAFAVSALNCASGLAARIAAGRWRYDSMTAWGAFADCRGVNSSHSSPRMKPTSTDSNAPPSTSSRAWLCGPSWCVFPSISSRSRRTSCASDSPSRCGASASYSVSAADIVYHVGTGVRPEVLISSAPMLTPSADVEADAGFLDAAMVNFTREWIQSIAHIHSSALFPFPSLCPASPIRPPLRATLRMRSPRPVHGTPPATHWARHLHIRIIHLLSPLLRIPVPIRSPSESDRLSHRGRRRSRPPLPAVAGAERPSAHRAQCEAKVRPAALTRAADSAAPGASSARVVCL
ncbi:hypothetical protein B0H10DRAFT_378296 [Mycena sp. CBHHK59/15]|nr:hypothetical protein B0H10DRAFT_378296 [Mycena sp. CBHHK59/15]